MSDLLTKDQLNAMSVDDLLDMDIGAIGILEGFTPVPTAEYRLEVVACKQEAIGKDEKPAIVVETNLLEVLQYEDDAEALPADSLPRAYKETFFLDSKDRVGLKKFRTVFAAFAESRGLTTTRAIQEALNEGGVTGSVLIKYRAWKDKDTGMHREGNEFDLTGFIPE